MTEKPYTNRELDHYFKEVHEKLDLIHDQTKKTNGRVSALEHWRWFMTGGITLLAFVVSIIVRTIF